MHRPPHILALCGSLREHSYTLRATQVVLDAAREQGASTELAPACAMQLPLCDGRAETDFPPPVLALRQRVASASALVLATPEYCGTLSAALKNAIEWIGPDLLAGKVIGVVSVAAGPSADGSLVALRELCLREGAWVIPARAAIPLAERVFGDPDDAFSQCVMAHVRALGAALPEAVARIAGPCADATVDAGTERSA